MFGALKTTTVVRVVVYWMAFVGLYWATGTLLGLAPGGVYFNKMKNWVSGTIAALLITWLFLLFENNKFSSIGLTLSSGTLRRFFNGWLLGTCMFIFMYAMLLMVPGVRLVWNSWHPDAWMVTGLLIILPLAIMEEVAFRSYSFVSLQKAYGLPATQLITATAFALYHVAMGWTWYIAFLGPFTWAFVFGAGAAWSRGIAVPAGIHVAVNLMQRITGLKGSEGICELNYIGNGATNAQRMGIFLQLAVLAAGILATAYLQWRRRTQTLASAEA